jgi:hypothetical protein
MRNFMDPHNYATYQKTENGKNVFRARKKEVVVAKSAIGKGICVPDISQYQEHLKADSLFRLGFSSKHGNKVLLMLDLDTDKQCPERKKQLIDSMRQLRNLLSNVYFEDATYSDDKHGYIIVSLPERYGRLRFRQVMLKAVAVLTERLPIKKLEIMGLPPVYDWIQNANEKWIISKVTKSGTIAKMPRVLKRKQLKQLLELGSIDVSVFELISASAYATAEEPASQTPSHGSSGCLERRENEDILLSGIKSNPLNKTSLSECNTKTFIDLWELVTFEERYCYISQTQTKNGKTYAKNTYISKTEWADYCLAWMLSVSRFDRNIEGRAPEHQSTVNHEWVDGEFEKLSGRKVDQKKRRWVMAQLLNWQILLGRNLTWHEGVSRKFGWSWGRLNSMLKEGTGLSFIPHAVPSNLTCEAFEGQ